MNRSDLWILCGRRVEICAFLHLRLGATIPLCPSSIGHFTWTNWVQVQSRRLSDVVWRLFLNGVPVALCPVVSPRKLLQFLLGCAVLPPAHPHPPSSSLGAKMFFLGISCQINPKKCSIKRKAIRLGTESKGRRCVA